MQHVEVTLETLEHTIITCARCPRLRQHCTRVAREKRRAYQDWEYWGKPVPGFGDPRARLLILGLAPGAHGANRTGRLFTGDRSGDWLFAALHRTGFASQASSTTRGDGLRLLDAYVSAVCRCAPPGNKPTPDEIRNCRSYLERELDQLERLRAVVALGKIAFDAYLAILRDRGAIASRKSYQFGHQREYWFSGYPVLLASYHPSQQNTSTGKLTEKMLTAVFERAHQVVCGA